MFFSSVCWKTWKLIFLPYMFGWNSIENQWSWAIVLVIFLLLSHHSAKPIHIFSSHSTLGWWYVTRNLPASSRLPCLLTYNVRHSALIVHSSSVKAAVTCSRCSVFNDLISNPKSISEPHSFSLLFSFYLFFFYFIPGLLFIFFFLLTFSLIQSSFCISIRYKVQLSISNISSF